MIKTEGAEGAGLDKAEDRAGTVEDETVGAGTDGDAAEVEGAERESDRAGADGAETGRSSRSRGTSRSSRDRDRGSGSVVGICVVCGSYLIRTSRSLSRTQDCGMWGRVRRRCWNRSTQLEIYTVYPYNTYNRIESN